MRTFKKLFTIAICVALMSCAMFSLTACAEEHSAGDFYYQIKDDGTAAIYVEKYDMQELEIPDTIAGLKVTTVKAPKKSEKVNTVLTNVIFPDTVQYIDKNAFKGCVGLEEINLPENLLEIGKAAFRSCSSLTEVRLPNKVKTVYESAFRDCSGLKAAYVPKSVTDMRPYAFKGCPNLEIWCERSEPTGFLNTWGGDGWSGDAKVHWDYKG